MLRAYDKDESGSRSPGWRAEMGFSDSDGGASVSDGDADCQALVDEWSNELVALQRQQLNPRDPFYSGPICWKQCLLFVKLMNELLSKATRLT